MMSSFAQTDFQATRGSPEKSGGHLMCCADAIQAARAFGMAMQSTLRRGIDEIICKPGEYGLSRKLLEELWRSP
jgi:hypothetical protein